MKVSIVIPVYNEEKNIPLLVEKLRHTLGSLEYEVILVNDGSSDGTQQVINHTIASASRCRAIHLQRNFGQTAAIAAGVDHAGGDVIIPMDGDLENDPADIPKLLAPIEQGYDVVSGWRQNRWEHEVLTRKIPSLIANRIISYIAGLHLHDYGCTMKAYRASILKNIRLYGDMHRFIAAYAHWNGAKVTEVPVHYAARIHGTSNYGIGRIWKVLLDMVTLKFLSGYATRPIHLFGGVGFISILLGMLAGLAAVYFKLSTSHQKDFVETPLPVMMAMMIVVGVVLIMLGLLAEILVRTYHESQGKPTYIIKNLVNMDNKT